MIDIGKEELKQIKGKGAQKLSKRDYDRKIAEWQMFYLNNLDIYTEDYLQIPLHFFQRQISLSIQRSINGLAVDHKSKSG